ncbi:MAG TPA: hypothetical protein VNO33_01705 [Kofleriaceae bacterium]|nr:hypothetical protein [Kofleriaceae bacterium]
MKYRRKVAPGTRLLAALSLCAFVAGSMGSLIHEATTTHAVCPEHGELVHGDAAAPVAGSLADRLEQLIASERTASGSEPSRARDMPPASGHEHDHCYVCCPTRERMADPTAAAPDTCASLDARAPLALAADPGSPGRSLYLTAPKTSPPA